MTTNDPGQLRAFVELAVTNLLQIEANLQKLGYKFANQHGAVGQLTVSANPALEKLRQAYDKVPDLLCVWYDRVEYVDFSQDKAQLSEPSDNPVAGLGLNCTLVFGSLSTVCERQTMLEVNGISCKKGEGCEFFPLGTFASNCMPKGVWLPDGANDPIIYDAGAGPVTMSDEIIQSIRAGGFPFWEQMFSKRRISSPIPNTPRYPDILPALLEGVVAM